MDDFLSWRGNFSSDILTFGRFNGWSDMLSRMNFDWPTFVKCRFFKVYGNNTLIDDDRR